MIEFIVPMSAFMFMRRTGCSIRTTDLAVTVPDLPRDPQAVRVAMLSDLHVGRMHVPIDELLSAVEAARPDMLILGGDYTSGSASHRAALEVVAALCEGLPTFAVLGNADHNQRLDARALRDILRAQGGDLLVNEVGRARVGDISIEVVGIDEPRHGNPNVTEALRSARGDADLRIGLSHSPALWREIEEINAHISFFGHTHGGQVRLPGFEAHITHRDYPRQLAAGLFRYRPGAERPERLLSHWDLMKRTLPHHLSAVDGRLLYVTRGVGMGFIPLRVSCPPELVVTEFRREWKHGGRMSDG